MNQHIQAVLFDLDGTLVDTAPDFIRIIKQLCEKHQHTCPTDTAIREQVSAGSKAMVRLMFADKFENVDDNDPTLLAYRQQFLDAYEADICVDSCLFSGLDDLLKNLEDNAIAWGIVTNKPRYLAEILLEKLHLNQRCAVLVCPEDVVNTKPDPEPLLLASKKLNLQPNQCIYVGDHIRDIQSGYRAGMFTILASYGYIPPEDQQNLVDWGADFIVNTPNELSQLIQDKFNIKLR